MNRAYEHQTPSPSLHHLQVNPRCFHRTKTRDAHRRADSSQMSLLLRRLTGRLRRSFSTVASRPPWAMVYHKPGLATSRAPGLDARASFDLNESPWASYLSVPAHFVDPDGDTTDFASGTVRAASGDGLLLLDFFDSRHYAPVKGKLRHSWLRELAIPATGRDGELHATRFVCNPLNGQLARLPDVDRASTKGGTGFGLLTQSEGVHGPPDRYVVAEVAADYSRGGHEIHGLLRRFLSETGEWDEVQLAGLSAMPAGRSMHIDHEVLAFGDRLWWVDVTWGVNSVDPFSDWPEVRFVELPDLVGMAGSLLLGRHRRMGVSEGKLRYVEVSTNKKPFVISSFSLDDEGCCWTLEHQMALNPIWADEFKSLEDDIPWIAAIDPLNSNVLYLAFDCIILAVDIAKGKEIGRSTLQDIVCESMCPSAGFLVPCVLPTWLDSSNIPSAGGALPRKKTDCRMKTLADMLVRADRDQKLKRTS